MRFIPSPSSKIIVVLFIYIVYFALVCSTEQS